MADTDILFRPATEQAALIRSKALSPVELTRAYLDRIEALEPRLNAFITVTAEVARAAARAAEDAVMRGEPLGLLHGVPYATKDILATRGIRTTNGSKVTADAVPDFDATVTAKLADAGAILLGKLNLSEFAMGSGTLSGFGPARNPWDTARSPAGSSSGSGAALAAGMTSLAVGTDTGGSIRGPAAVNGVVGLKATYGRVSRYGVSPLAWSLDHAGPMARTVADAALMLQAMAGFDPLDRTTDHTPVPPYAEQLGGDLKGVRIGVPVRHFAVADAQAQGAFEAALMVLESLGATLVDVDVPHAPYAGSAGHIITLTEAAAYHEQRMADAPELFDPIIRERMEASRFYSALDYIKCQRIRSLLMDEMAAVFTRCEVMATPANGGLAGLLESAETAGSEIKPGSSPTEFRVGNTFLGNMTGLPAMVQPCGFSSGDTPLPIGIQFYARAYDEAAMFRIGHAYEQATDWHLRHPIL